MPCLNFVRPAVTETFPEIYHEIYILYEDIFMLKVTSITTLRNFVVILKNVEKLTPTNASYSTLPIIRRTVLSDLPCRNIPFYHQSIQYVAE
jgi:hypothetical protein